MNKRLIGVIFLAFIALCAVGQASNRYRVWLTDKADNSYSIDRPEEFLSAKAIERRAQRHIEITQQDLPVSPSYLRQIEERGFRIITTSRWMNTVVVAPGDYITISEIEQLPFIEKVECVQKEDRIVPLHTKFTCSQEDVEPYENNTDEWATYYGAAWAQINQLNLAPLHQEGYRGNGMTIAVLDAGFYCIDLHPSINQSQIIGTHDFTRKSFSYKNGVDHGASVLMCMATNAPNTHMGTAPDAYYWLMTTEDNNRECPIEEDYWVAGAEMADSVGADIITSSLGYNLYDDPDMSYTHADMDGKTAFCSRGATIAASKGMLVVTAAGNEYSKSWRKIVVPGDAEGIITVGSVNNDGLHSSFSSIGYSADGRVKPDVVALGNSVKILHTDGMITSVTGTSFATPLMTGALACLWQAHPEWSVPELIDRVQKGASQYHTPDSLLGYGLPDIYAIHCNANSINSTIANGYDLYIVNKMLHLPTTSQPTIITIHDTCGRVVWKSVPLQDTNLVDVSHIEPGIYIITATTNNSQKAQKIIIG